MKGIIFAGDSYTWGEGLHYYSDLHFDYDKPIHDYEYIGYDRNKLSASQIEFIKCNRYSRKVANYFNTFDVVRKNNGGQNAEIFEFIDKIQNAYQYDYNLGIEGAHRAFKFIHKDFDYAIVQLTDMFREETKFEYENELRSCNIRDIYSIKNSKFDKFIEENFEGNINNYLDVYLKNYADFIETKFKEYEHKGIKKCFLITWQNDIIPFIHTNPFLNERFITFDIDGNTFNSIWDLQTRNDRPKSMSISDDLYFVTKNIRVVNGHTSLTAHNIIAKSIIKKIEENESTRIHSI